MSCSLTADGTAARLLLSVVATLHLLQLCGTELGLNHHQLPVMRFKRLPDIIACDARVAHDLKQAEKLVVAFVSILFLVCGWDAVWGVAPQLNTFMFVCVCVPVSVCVCARGLPMEQLRH